MHLPTIIATLCATLSIPATSLAEDERSTPIADSGLIVFPDRIELGDVAPDTTVTSQAWLVNTTLRPITIDHAKAGCGCTTMPFTSLTLDPGEIHRVAFDVKTPKIAGESKAIPIRFTPAWGDMVATTATLTTVDTHREGPTDAQTQSGTLVLIPHSSHLGDVPGGTPVDTTAWIVNTGTTAAYVSKFKAGCGCTEVIGFQATSIAAGHALPVRLRVTPKAIVKPDKRVTIAAFIDDTPIEATLAMSVVEAPQQTAAR